MLTSNNNCSNIINKSKGAFAYTLHVSRRAPSSSPSPATMSVPSTFFRDDLTESTTTCNNYHLDKRHSRNAVKSNQSSSAPSSHVFASASSSSVPSFAYCKMRKVNSAHSASSSASSSSSSITLAQVFMVAFFILAHCMTCVSTRKSDPPAPIANIRPPQLADKGHLHYITTYECEGKKLDLSCGDGQMIHLVRANYGRFSLSICNPSGQINLSVNCMSHRSFLVMQDRCAQSSNCSIVVSSKTFGDPCPGTSKYLEVQYHCAHPTPINTTVANSDHVSHSNNNSGANLGASNVPTLTAPVIVTARKSASSYPRESDTVISASSPSFNFDGVNVSPPSLKAPYEATSAVNSTAISATTTVTSVATPPSRDETSSSSSASSSSSPLSPVSSSRGGNIATVVTFKATDGNKSSRDDDNHPYHVSSKSNKPNVPTEIVGNSKFNIRNSLPSGLPESPLSPWPDNDNYRKTLDDLFKEKDSSSEMDLSNSVNSLGGSSGVTSEDEDDGMMLMAIALFFIVFFLVLATFGLIYCILRSDHVRSRKLVSRIPFITCLFGPDISSDVEVEKVSSVVASSAYGTTSGTTGPVSFPIIATRVPTQITSTSATGFESTSSSSCASSLNVKAGNSSSLGVSSSSNQQSQLTSPCHPQGCKWYQASPASEASAVKRSTNSSYMTSSHRFMGREAVSTVPSFAHVTSDELTLSTVASSMPSTATLASTQQHSTPVTCSSFSSSSSNHSNSNSNSSNCFNTTTTNTFNSSNINHNSSMSQLLLLNNCVNYSADVKSNQFTTGPIKINSLIDSTDNVDDTYLSHLNTNAVTDDCLYHETCDAAIDHSKLVINCSSSPSSSSSTPSSTSINSSAVLVTGGNNGANGNLTSVTPSNYHANLKSGLYDDSALVKGISSPSRANSNNNFTKSNIVNNNYNSNKFLLTSSLYRPSKSKSARSTGFKSQAKNLITNPWELLMGNSSSSTSSSPLSHSSQVSSSKSGISRSTTGHMAFESVNPRYTCRPDMLQQHLQQQHTESQQLPLTSSPMHPHLKFTSPHLRNQIATSTLLLNVTGHCNSPLSSNSSQLQHHFSNLHLPSTGNSEHVYESIDTDSLSSNFNIHENHQRLPFQQQHQQQQLHSSVSSSSRSLIPSDTRILNV